MRPVLLFLTSLLSGCIIWSAERMNYISIGMTKAEVIDEIGTPRSSSAQGNTEYMNYVFTERYGIAVPQNYFVRLVNGKVESYGRAGDFDSTKNPTLDVNIRNR